MAVSNEVLEQIFSLAHADDPIGVFPLEEREQVLVVEWVETLPAREDEYAALREESLQDLVYVLANQAMRQWLQPENLRARNGVEVGR